MDLNLSSGMQAISTRKVHYLKQIEKIMDGHAAPGAPALPFTRLFPNLQVLEGPSQSVDKLYSKINNDGRHKNVRNLVDRHIEERMFPSWSMKFSPFNNLELSNKDFKRGNFLNIKPEQAASIFDTIKDMTS